MCRTVPRASRASRAGQARVGALRARSRDAAVVGPARVCWPSRRLPAVHATRPLTAGQVLGMYLWWTRDLIILIVAILAVLIPSNRSVHLKILNAIWGT